MLPDNSDLDDDVDFGEQAPWEHDRKTPRVIQIFPTAGNPNDPLDFTDPNNPVPIPAYVDIGAYEKQCPGDVNEDGQVELTDLATVLGCFGLPGCSAQAGCAQQTLHVTGK